MQFCSTTLAKKVTTTQIILGTSMHRYPNLQSSLTFASVCELLLMRQTALEYKGHRLAQLLLTTPQREDREKVVETSAINQLLLRTEAVLSEHAQTHDDTELGVAI